MEENFKSVELSGLCNDQLFRKFYEIINGREVDNVTFFINFKPAKVGQRTERNVQEKTMDAINSIKEKRRCEQMLKNLQVNYIQKTKESLGDKISKMYEQAQYEKIIAQLVPLVESQSENKENQNILEVGKTSNQDYNLMTFSLGNSYFRLKKYDEAIKYYQLTKQEEPTRQKGQRLNNLGACHAIKRSYQLALKAYSEAIRYYSQGQVEDVSNIFNNIAMIYLKCDMYKSAQQFFVESIKQRKDNSSNNKNMMYCSYFNLGICQKNNKKLQDSLNSLFIALNYATDGYGKKIQVLNQICLVYESLEKWAEALLYYEKLSDEYEVQKQPQGIIYERVSKIHQSLGNQILAAKFAKKAYKIYSQQGNDRKLSELSASPLFNMPNTY